MITPAIAELNLRVRQKFAAEFASGALYSLGIYNRRYISGTDIWSQHAWGNAWDIGVARSQRPALGDRVKAWIRGEDAAGRLATGLILWNVRNHYNHLHVEGDPKKFGVPPLPQEEDDMEAFVEAEQENLNDAGFRDSSGNRLDVDGLLGPKTQSAMLARDKAAKSGGGFSMNEIAADQSRRLLDG